MPEQSLPNIPRDTARRVFPALLRQTREASGATGTELAAALRVRQPTYAQYENGARLPDHAKLLVLLDTMGMGERAALLAHVLEAARRGDGDRGVPKVVAGPRERFEVLARFAQRATLYEPGVVPAVARTPAYEAALHRHRGGDPWWEPRAHPPHGALLELFVDEAALRVPLDGPPVMAGQVRALLEHAGTTVRLVPPTALVDHPTRGLPISLLQVLPTWWCGYSHTPLAGYCHDRPERVDRCADRMRALLTGSLGAGLSRELLHGLLVGYEAGRWPAAERAAGQATVSDQDSG